jgi:excisionase family DNA binding protein
LEPVFFYEEKSMSEQLESKATLSEEEFCKRVGISRTTAWRMRNAGKLPYCRVGDKVLYLPRHIEEFLSNCERRPRQRGKLAVQE